GLEIQLARDNAGSKDANRSKVKGDLSGVETIILKQTVRMDLYPDASSGFLTGSDPPPVDPKKGPEKSHVVIETEGQFRFEVAKDLAHFASPAAKVHNSSN